MQRELVKVARELDTANAKLKRFSTTILAGIANRRALDDLLSREWRCCARIKKTGSLYQAKKGGRDWVVGGEYGKF